MHYALLQILKNSTVKLCVLATASADNQPWCCVLGYAVKDDLTIILSTKKSSKKVKNLSENNKVSLVFGFNFMHPNVQCEGIAKVVSEGQEFKERAEFYYTINPDVGNFKSAETIFIAVTPTMARISNYQFSPPQIEELSF